MTDYIFRDIHAYTVLYTILYYNKHIYYLKQTLVFTVSTVNLSLDMHIIYTLYTTYTLLYFIIVTYILNSIYMYILYIRLTYCSLAINTIIYVH